MAPPQQYRPLRPVETMSLLVVSALALTGAASVLEIIWAGYSLTLSEGLDGNQAAIADHLALAWTFGGALTWLMAPVALIIGGIGAVSVFKAVYVDKRELKCACVGGASNVPLGFVSLTENLVMVGMAIWMVLWAM